MTSWQQMEGSNGYLKSANLGASGAQSALNWSKQLAIAEPKGHKLPLLGPRPSYRMEPTVWPATPSRTGLPAPACALQQQHDSPAGPTSLRMGAGCAGAVFATASLLTPCQTAALCVTSACTCSAAAPADALVFDRHGPLFCCKCDPAVREHLARAPSPSVSITLIHSHDACLCRQAFGGLGAQDSPRLQAHPPSKNESRHRHSARTTALGHLGRVVPTAPSCGASSKTAAVVPPLRLWGALAPPSSSRHLRREARASTLPTLAIAKTL